MNTYPSLESPLQSSSRSKTDFGVELGPNESITFISTSSDPFAEELVNATTHLITGIRVRNHKGQLTTIGTECITWKQCFKLLVERQGFRVDGDIAQGMVIRCISHGNVIRDCQPHPRCDGIDPARRLKKKKKTQGRITWVLSKIIFLHSNRD